MNYFSVNGKTQGPSFSPNLMSSSYCNILMLINISYDISACTKATKTVYYVDKKEIVLEKLKQYYIIKNNEYISTIELHTLP